MRTPLEIADAVFPPDECDFHPPETFQPMFGSRNYAPGHTTDVTVSPVDAMRAAGGIPYLIG